MTDIDDIEFWKKLYFYSIKNKTKLPQYILNDIQTIENIKSQLIYNRKLTKIQIIHAKRIINNFKKFDITLEFIPKIITKEDKKYAKQKIEVIKKLISCPPHDHQVISESPRRIIRKCVVCNNQQVEKIY
jgi:hypothetical protein